MKNLLIHTVHASRLYRLFTPFYGGHTSILLLHRVKPRGETSGLDGGHEVSPEFLEEFIARHRGWGWRFISLDYLLEHYDECSRRKKNLVITLDDGYLDNYQFAYPLFRKYQVPFAIYVTTSFPNGTADLWWYKLARVINGNSEIVVESGAEKATISCQDRKHAFADLRRRFLSLQPAEQSRFMAQLMDRYGAGYVEERYAMSWQEIAELSRDELCTIGCHTVNHGNLRNLSRDDAYNEMVIAKREIEERLGLPVRHFSYPYGTEKEASSREEGLAREAGFATAVTTRVGNLFDEHRQRLHMLPRIPLYDGGRNGMLSDIFMSGMYGALANGFRKVPA